MAHTNANADVNSDNKQNTNINFEQALDILSALTDDIDFARQRNSEIKQNAEQGFATITEQTTKTGQTQFVIYNAHLAKTSFLAGLHINLNADEQQAIDDGIKHRTDSNNKHNITQKANSVIEQLSDSVLEQFNVRKG